jgi:hypothetical protein
LYFNLVSNPVPDKRCRKIDEAGDDHFIEMVPHPVELEEPSLMTKLIPIIFRAIYERCTFSACILVNDPCPECLFYIRFDIMKAPARP